jgi:hypothetical protein
VSTESWELQHPTDVGTVAHQQSRDCALPRERDRGKCISQSKRGNLLTPVELSLTSALTALPCSARRRQISPPSIPVAPTIKYMADLAFMLGHSQCFDEIYPQRQ